MLLTITRVSGWHILSTLAVSGLLKVNGEDAQQTAAPAPVSLESSVLTSQG